MIIAAVLAFVGGCSSGSTPTPAPGSSGTPGNTTGATKDDGLPDPCSLLTGAEVDAATGLDFGEGAINAMVSQEFLKACDWVGPGGVQTVQVLVTNVDGSYDGNKTSAAGVYGSADDVTVAGATRAYAVKGGFLIGMDMDDVFLQVSYITTSPKVAAATLDLAGKAAGRMP
jgi:hypothetical protein